MSKQYLSNPFKAETKKLVTYQLFSFEKRNKVKEVTCYNCGEKGHLKKSCPKPENMDFITCKNCGQKGHMSTDCKTSNEAKLEFKTCYFCGQVGHLKKDCPSKINKKN